MIERATKTSNKTRQEERAQFRTMGNPNKFVLHVTIVGRKFPPSVIFDDLHLGDHLEIETTPWFSCTAIRDKGQDVCGQL